ncbi:MAG: COX15/CtaA family protein [Alphaproteobacteria bacterium]
MPITATEQTSRHRAVATWLLVCCAAIFVMVVLGGVTRLTKSGLSMVEWQLSTLLPPLDDLQWRDVFEKYQRFPEYQLRNKGMTLEEFKGIFWLEYVHRLWGRGIGVLFFVPFVYFVVRGWVDRLLGTKLFLIFLVGGLQGGVGWFMVKSGLVDHPEVSQYRLTAHLALAVILYGAILWVAMGLLAPRNRFHDLSPALRGMVLGIGGLVALTFVTMLSGALVAGLKAGLGFNTFPLMNGQFLPDGALSMTPVVLNFFENHATVQFDHRILAEVTGLVILLLWLTKRRSVPTGRGRLALHALGGMAVVQLALGISTLLLMVPVALAATHQAGALVLLTLGLWLLHEMMGLPPSTPGWRE